VTDNVPVHLAAAALGIAVMCAVAQFISWFEPLAGRKGLGRAPAA